MEYKIIGQDFQILQVYLKEGEKIYSEAGAMAYMSGNIRMEAKAIGGFAGILKRALARESIFLVEYTSEYGDGFVAFTPTIGKVIPLQLNQGQSIIAQKDAVIAMTTDVDVSVTFARKIGAGLFGGEGFILEKITANEDNQMIFLEAAGQLISFELESGQTIKVDTGNIVAFDNSVDYDIQRAGNIKTMLFGGEGLFLAKLTGPGRVWLQSTNIQSLAAKVGKYLTKG